MRMTDAQLAQYRRDGYIIFPALFIVILTPMIINMVDAFS